MTFAAAFMALCAVMAIRAGPRERVALALIAGALPLVYVSHNHVFSREGHVLFHVAIWTLIGFLIVLKTRGSCWLGSILLVVAGLLIVPSYLAGEPFAFGSPIYRASNVFGVAAILCIGSRRIRVFGDTCVAGGLRLFGDLVRVAGQKEKAK